MVLNLQPAASIDYDAFRSLPSRAAMTGEWLAFCSACPMPEIANVFARCGIQFNQVNGALENDPACWDEIEQWIAAAQVCGTLCHTRLGLMGHSYGGMLDIATDLLSTWAYEEMLEGENSGWIDIAHQRPHLLALRLQSPRGGPAYIARNPCDQKDG